MTKEERTKVISDAEKWLAEAKERDRVHREAYEARQAQHRFLMQEIAQIYADGWLKLARDIARIEM